MPSPRETILAALHARLSALPATALRGDVLPQRVPAEGLLPRLEAEIETHSDRLMEAAGFTLPAGREADPLHEPRPPFES